MNKKYLSFGLFIFVLALALRLFRIGSQSLWVDELLTLSMSNPKPGLNIWDYLKYNIHGPLHSFVVYLFHLVSMNDAWLRLPSALAGAGAVVFFYRWIRIWLGEGIARTASLLLVIHPLHIFYSQELRNYSLLFFFAMFSSYYLHRLLAGETRRNCIFYTLGIAAGALCNFTSAFLYAVHSLIFLIRRDFTRQRIIRWVLVSLAILVLISPWVYRIYTFIDVSKLVTPVMPGEISTTDRLRGETTVSPAAVPYAFYVYSVGFSLGPSTRELHKEVAMATVLRRHAGTVAVTAILFGTLFLFGAYRVVRTRMHTIQIALYLFIPIVLTLLLCWQNAKAFTVRYVLLSLPAYLALVAIGIRSLPRRLSWAASVLVAGTMLFSLSNYYFNGRYAREDVRAAARDIDERAAPGDCVLAPTVYEVFDHYYPREEDVYYVFSPPWYPKDKVDLQLERIFANCDTLWYVESREWAHDSDGYVMRALTSHYEQMETTYYDGVTVRVYGKP